ncbi:hypothetical protein RTBOTA2_002735 [Rhodotorula toruloides]|nr:hypothetical protein RTBOTA2_002735 [Rhodotorula toruloides]
MWANSRCAALRMRGFRAEVDGVQVDGDDVHFQSHPEVVVGDLKYAKNLGKKLDLIFEAASKATWAVSQDAYTKLKEEYDMKLRGGPWDKRIKNRHNMWQGLVFTHNLPCDPHFDTKDPNNILIPQFPLGVFEGGQLVLEQFGLSSEYAAGDMVFLLTRRVKHAVLKFSPEGCRHTMICLWQESFLGLDRLAADWEAINNGTQPTHGDVAGLSAAKRAADQNYLQPAPTLPRPAHLTQPRSSVTGGSKRNVDP